MTLKVPRFHQGADARRDENRSPTCTHTVTRCLTNCPSPIRKFGFHRDRVCDDAGRLRHRALCPARALKIARQRSGVLISDVRAGADKASRCVEAWKPQPRGSERVECRRRQGHHNRVWTPKSEFRLSNNEHAPATPRGKQPAELPTERIVQYDFMSRYANWRSRKFAKTAARVLYIHWPKRSRVRLRAPREKPGRRVPQYRKARSGSPTGARERSLPARPPPE